MLNCFLKSKEVSLPLTIRAPTIDELSDLSDLCFRSKAVWGYDEEFMDACRGELSFEPRDLELTPIAVAEHDGKPIGVAQVKVVDDEADLLKLFVEPSQRDRCFPASAERTRLTQMQWTRAEPTRAASF